MLLNAGIERVVYLHPYRDEIARQMVAESGLEVEQHPNVDHWVRFGPFDDVPPKA
jgi:deoxycytidylate deaminase